ncbi:N-acetylglutamate synthase, GNAT family [Geodermatophilus africanus]|uniref:N-acetylglutamate synthase, GNAT family n=1 Tax=Geodermatophilus africanus TaxID=1137993 RepID=A0A1H3GZR5_9ACTN|nr:GNAT family N-acetyltransferase [Geodermatophilus africanus]SDY08128.1 N-acetylglutamate synthase, GNAT family [Geodermatophilus africanus]
MRPSLTPTSVPAPSGRRWRTLHAAPQSPPVLVGTAGQAVLPATADALQHGAPVDRALPVDGRGSRFGETLRPLTPADVPDLLRFLTCADLTGSGLRDPAVRLWVLRDATGQVQGSAGYELSEDGRQALIRSVAVDASRRGEGLGLRLAGFTLQRAAEEGARQAWLFSRHRGAFWRRLGFEPADRDALARVLAGTHQVRLFHSNGQMQHEVAWRRSLVGLRDGGG